MRAAWPACYRLQDPAPPECRRDRQPGRLCPFCRRDFIDRVVERKRAIQQAAGDLAAVRHLAQSRRIDRGGHLALTVSTAARMATRGCAMPHDMPRSMAFWMMLTFSCEVRRDVDGGVRHQQQVGNSPERPSDRHDLSGVWSVGPRRVARWRRSLHASEYRYADRLSSAASTSPRAPALRPAPQPLRDPAHR
jgi:hypothetical protein